MEPDQKLAEHSRQLELLNREMINTREMAIRAVQAKSEFLSNMSHELRTPLNSILGMTDLLKETNLNSQQQDLLTVLRRNGESLLQLIDDILHFSKLESGKIPLNCEAFSLQEIVSKVVEMLKPLADRKNLSLSTRVSSTLPIFLQGDPQKLEQILVNLMGNAIKFTREGRISLHVEKGPGGPEEVLFSIQDTGIGIPKEKMMDLFKRFSQTDASISKFYGGTGLGLAISKQLTELMGGKIWVESEPGQGSKFQFTVRLPATAKVTEPKKENSSVSQNFDLSGRRILLAEDSKDNALLISLYLKGTGCQLDHVENGKAALESFSSSDYDLILMDMQMPEMDGYSATRWIRILEKQKNKKVIVIALTAFAFQEEADKSLAAGCDLHLNKPITKPALLKTLQSAFAGSEKTLSSLPAPL